MASSGIGKAESGTERAKGHYKAYGSDCEVIWEQKEFTVGVDSIPPGLSDAMRAMQITNGKTVVRRWDPHNMLHDAK